MKPYQNIIFDLGRVLFAWDPNTLVKDLRSQDESFPEEMVHLPSTDPWKRFDSGHLSQKQLQELFSSMFNKKHLSIFFEELQKKFLPLEKGVSLFQKIQKTGKYNTYVLSNMPKEYGEYLLQTFPFLHEFTGRVFSYEAKANKPDPSIYQYLFQKFSLSPQSCLFIDDLPANIAAAKSLDMDGLVYENPLAIEKELQSLGIL